MKKSLLSIFAMATMLLATGCSQEDELVNGGENGELVEVTFNLKSGEGPQSRAISDGKKAKNLYCGVFDQQGNVIPTQHQQVVMQDPTVGTTVTFQLVKGQTYDFVFWAQTQDESTPQAEKYYNVNKDDLTEISVNYGTDANDEARDAFFAHELDYKVEGRFTKTVELRRPFGQLNVGTTQKDYELATELLSKKAVNKSKLVVKNLPNTLNLLTGKLGESVAEEAVFELAALPKDGTTGDYEILEVDVNGDKQIAEDEKYVHLSMNYLLAAQDESELHGVDVTFANGDTEDDIINTINVPNVPIQRNYRTNILGQILTTEGDFTIKVVPIYDGDHNYFLSELTVASTAELAEVMAQLNDENYDGPTNVTINLSGDVEWATGSAGDGFTKILTNEKLAVTINGNNHKLTAIGSGALGHNVGSMYFKDITIEDQTSYTSENGEVAWEFCYLELEGTNVFEDVTFANTVMFSGDVIVRNSTFEGASTNESNKENEYTAWVNDGSVAFENCTFEGYRGLKMHEAYGSEISNVSIEGCVFKNLGKKPGVVIGTLNAATTVTIKNSVFVNCQAGDQNLYIYETDTDVTTFNFTEENNTVINEANANVVMDIKDLTNSTTAVVLTEDVQVGTDNFIHTQDRTNDLTIYGNGNTIVSTATSVDDFEWVGGTIPDMSTIFSSANGSTVTVNDLTFEGTMSALMLGHYQNATYNNYNTVLNNVNVINTEVVSFSSNVSPAVCVYGTATLNECYIYGTTLSPLDTDPMWPVYDLVAVNYTDVTINKSKIGSLYMWNQAKVTIGNGTTVESIIIKGDMNTTKYGLTIADGAKVESIDLSAITNKTKINITIEGGATVGKIVANGVEYASLDEWKNA